MKEKSERDLVSYPFFRIVRGLCRPFTVNWLIIVQLNTNNVTFATFDFTELDDIRRNA